MYGGVPVDNKWRAPKDDCAIQVRTKKCRGAGDIEDENDEVGYMIFFYCMRFMTQKGVHIIIFAASTMGSMSAMI